MFSTQKMRRKLASFAVVLATALAFTQASHALGHDSGANACSTKLRNLNYSQQRQLAHNFEKFEYAPLNNGKGFSMELLKSSGTEETRTIAIPSDPIDGEFLMKNVWRNVYSYNGKKYEVVSVGLKTLETYSMRQNQIVLEHVMLHPDKRLVVLYDPMRAFIGQRIETHRWAHHEEVLEVYDLTKTDKLGRPYILPSRRQLLEDINRWSDNSHVTSILKYRENSPNSFLHLSDDDVKDHLLATTQTSYFGNRNFIKPTPRELYVAAQTPFNNVHDMLPHEHGIEKALLPEYRQKLYNMFEPSETVEILRTFNRNLPNVDLEDDSSDDGVLSLPTQVYEAWRYDEFRKIEASGAKNILAGLDDKTKRRFGGRPELFQKNLQLGFKEFMPFPRSTPLKEGDIQEYTYYMVVGSPEYNRLMSILAERSKDVERLWEPLP